MPNKNKYRKRSENPHIPVYPKPDTTRERENRYKKKNVAKDRSHRRDNKYCGDDFNVDNVEEEMEGAIDISNTEGLNIQNGDETLRLEIEIIGIENQLVNNILDELEFEAQLLEFDAEQERIEIDNLRHDIGMGFHNNTHVQFHNDSLLQAFRDFQAMLDGHADQLNTIVARMENFGHNIQNFTENLNAVPMIIAAGAHIAGDCG